MTSGTARPAPNAADPVHEIRVPRLNANDDEVVITQWLVGAGEEISAAAPVVSVETTKSQAELTSESAGYVEPLAAVGDHVQIGGVVAKVHPSPVSVEAGEPTAPAPRRPITDAARKLLDELGLSPDDVPGTGLITKTAAAAHVERQAAPAAGTAGRIPLSTAQLHVGGALRRGQAEAVPGFISRPVPTGQVERLVERIGRRDRVLVSSTDVLLKACSLALQRFPRLHGWVDGSHLRVPTRPRIGVAVEIGDDLFTPAAPDPTTTPLAGLARWRLDAQLALQRGEQPGDTSSPTFTLSNLTEFGVEWFVPNLAAGCGGALGIGASRDAWNLCLTFDHRSVNGGAAARFLQHLAEAITDPDELPCL